MLPPNNGVLAQVADVGDTGLAARFHQHPANVGVEETFVGIVRIQLGVGVAMVSAVATRPPFNGTFNSARTSNSEEVLQWYRRVIRAVGPKAVVPSGNAKASEVVVEDGEEEGLPTEFGKGSANDAYNWGDAEDDDVEPVKVVAPVGPIEGRKGFLCR